MSPEAQDLLDCFDINGYDSSLKDKQPMVEVEFPEGTINVEGAEEIKQGWLSYLYKCIVLTYEHPSWGAGRTIKTQLSHAVGSDWVKDGDFVAVVDPNVCDDRG